MEALLLHNLKAGGDHPKRKELVGMVRDAGFKVKYHNLRDALEKPKLLERGDFIIVAGGDGSIRKLALKMIDCPVKRFAPLPLGTANNIASTLGITGKLEKIVDSWRKPKLRAFDIGVANGPWGTANFIESFGFGLVSRAISVLQDIDKASEREFKTPEDKLHRDHCVFTALGFEVSPTLVRMKLDGEPLFGSFILFEALNIGRAGPGLELAPKASPSDGKLDIVRVAAPDRLALIARMKDTLFGWNSSIPPKTERAETVDLQLNTDSVHLDGRVYPLAGRTKIQLSLLPGALQVMGG